jgi:hypothetical protein
VDTTRAKNRIKSRSWAGKVQPGQGEFRSRIRPLASSVPGQCGHVRRTIRIKYRFFTKPILLPLPEALRMLPISNKAFRRLPGLIAQASNR